MFFFDKLFPARKLGSRRNYPHFFSGSEQEKEGEEGKKEKKTKWEKSQGPIKIRLNVVPKKDLSILKHGCFFYNWHPSNTYVARYKAENDQMCFLCFMSFCVFFSS